MSGDVNPEPGDEGWVRTGPLRPSPGLCVSGPGDNERAADGLARSICEAKVDGAVNQASSCSTRVRSMHNLVPDRASEAPATLAWRTKQCCGTSARVSGATILLRPPSPTSWHTKQPHPARCSHCNCAPMLCARLRMPCRPRSDATEVACVSAWASCNSNAFSEP